MKLQLSFLIISYLKLAQAQIPTAEEGQVCGAGVVCSQFGFFADGNGMRRGLVCQSSSGSNVIPGNETGVCRYVVPLNEGCGVERLIEGKLIVPLCNQINGRLTCLAGTCQNIAILGEPCEEPNPQNARGPAKCAEGLICVKRQFDNGICEEPTSSSTVVQSSSTVVQPSSTTITVKPTQTATVVRSTVVYSSKTTALVEGGASGVAALSFTGMIALLFF